MLSLLCDPRNGVATSRDVQAGDPREPWQLAGSSFSRISSLKVNLTRRVLCLADCTPKQSSHSLNLAATSCLPEGAG